MNQIKIILTVCRYAAKNKLIIYLHSIFLFRQHFHKYSLNIKLCLGLKITVRVQTDGQCCMWYKSVVLGQKHRTMVEYVLNIWVQFLEIKTSTHVESPWPQYSLHILGHSSQDNDKQGQVTWNISGMLFADMMPILKYLKGSRTDLMLWYVFWLRALHRSWCIIIYTVLPSKECCGLLSKAEFRNIDFKSFSKNFTDPWKGEGKNSNCRWQDLGMFWGRSSDFFEIVLYFNEIPIIRNTETVPAHPP